MSADPDGRIQEVRRLAREREWIPVILALGAAAVGYWRNEGFQTPTAMDAIIVAGMFGVLWSVLDIRVMLARHHWATLQK
ncbi:hypothetical protein [Sulfitobacter sp. W074]|uniref:hypothetical protein n=1 Tax=Sulfitobacter sp. W074 TaxID=2867026 RepID=UPI0021A667D0|nr:hypothetical protein [Sulfitobacter sp. W074]UWR37694.1 hypothetical protein K3762_01215 [Sulfitobacter sp. W074]